MLTQDGTGLDVVRDPKIAAMFASADLTRSAASRAASGVADQTSHVMHVRNRKSKLSLVVQRLKHRGGLDVPIEAEARDSAFGA